MQRHLQWVSDWAWAVCPVSTAFKSLASTMGPHYLAFRFLAPPSPLYHPGVSLGLVWLKYTHGMSNWSHPGLPGVVARDMYRVAQVEKTKCPVTVYAILNAWCIQIHTIQWHSSREINRAALARPAPDWRGMNVIGCSLWTEMPFQMFFGTATL